MTDALSWSDDSALLAYSYREDGSSDQPPPGYAISRT